jgi:membrane associated rhomboid family serine protease
VIPLRDANPARRTPVVTYAIAGLCGIVFAWQLSLLARGGDEALVAFIERWGTIPAELSAALRAGDVLSEPVVDVFTSMFIHAGWLHLLGNLLFLWIFANNVEDRLGRALFLAFYLGGGVAAVLAQTLIDPTSETPMIGASGAISATLGAYAVLFPGARIQSLVFLGFFYQLVAVPAVLVWVSGSCSRSSTASRPWVRRPGLTTAWRSSPTSAGSWPGRCARCRSGPAGRAPDVIARHSGSFGNEVPRSHGIIRPWPMSASPRSR